MFLALALFFGALLLLGVACAVGNAFAACWDADSHAAHRYGHTTPDQDDEETA